MGINKLIYSPEVGIGILTGVNRSNGYFKVVSPDKSVKQLPHVGFMDDAWYNILSSAEIIQTKFYHVTYKKGLDYYLDGKVMDIGFDAKSNTITANVSGSDVYSARIRMNLNHSLTMRCSCPVGSSCKHCAAVLIKINKLIKYCATLSVPDSSVSTSAFSQGTTVPEAIENKVREVIESSKIADVYNNIHRLNDALLRIDCTDYLMKKIIEQLENARGSYANILTFNTLDIALASDRRICNKLDSILGCRTSIWTMHSRVYSLFGTSDTVPRNTKYFSKDNLVTACSFRLGPHDVAEGLNMLLYERNFDSDFTDYMFRYFLAKSGAPENTEAIIRNILKVNGIYNTTAVRLIHSLLSPEFWQELVDSHHNHIDVDTELLDELSEKDRIILVPRVHDDKEAVNYLADNLKNAVLKYPSEAAVSIEKLSGGSYPTYTEKKLQRLAASLPMSDYFAAYLCRRKPFFEEVLYEVPYDYEKLRCYFEISCDAGVKSEECLFYIKFISPALETLLNVIFDRNFENYSVTSNYSYSYNTGFSKVSYNVFFSAFVKDYIAENGEEIKRILGNIEKKIEEERQKRIADEMRSSVSSITGLLYKRRIRLMPSQRASLEFFFTEKSERECTVTLSAKISNGNGKYYIIKNFKKFLSDCRVQDTVEYGKGFELTHIMSNFDDNAQSVLSFLLNSDFSESYDYHDRRYLALTYYALNGFMSAAKGGHINWFAKLYSVRLKHFSYKVSVDENNVISFPLTKGTHELLICADTMYDFNNEEGTVDIIDGSEELHALMLFAFRQNGNSINPVLKEFKTDIYPRLAQFITIPEEKMQEYRLGNAEINAYFDYADRIISVRTDIVKDNCVVTADSLSSRGDRALFDSYRSYMDMLGFKTERPAESTVIKADAWLSGDAQVLSFFSMDFTELRKYCNVYLSDSIQNRILTVFQPPVIRIKYESEIMQAFAEDSEYSDSELENILKALRLKKKYVLLSGNRIVRIDNEEAEDFAETVNDLGLDEKTVTEAKQIPVSTSIRALAHEANCKVDDYLVNMINDIKAFKTSKIPLPDVSAELRSYQKEGFRWLKILSDYKMGGILADDMGLGKTLEVITLFKSDDSCRPSLVVCPKSLIFNWKTEFEKFDPDTEVTEIYGTAAEREKAISAIDEKKKTVYITSYDSLRNDREKYTVSFNYLILDEAQYIKNINAQKSQSVKDINAVHKFALTGTPIENNVLDLWSIFDFILPGYFENLSTFRHRYETEDRFTEIIARRVSPFILRRTKKDVLKDLPEKFERILTAEMDKDQRKLYEAYRKIARDKIHSGGKAFDMLPILTRLRQICVDPAMFAEDYHGKSAKIALLADLLPEYLGAGHRMLIFSQFVKGLESVEDLLKNMGLPYFKLTGDTQSSERIRLVNEFNNKTDTNIFLISLKAGGTGLNLTGADTVIHLDPWWNVAAENQATDRTHRIGQTKNVEVIKIICADSVEQKVIDLQNRKKDLVDKLISDDDSSVTGARLEDIAFVIE